MTADLRERLKGAVDEVWPLYLAELRADPSKIENILPYILPRLAAVEVSGDVGIRAVVLSLLSGTSIDSALAEEARLLGEAGSVVKSLPETIDVKPEGEK